MSLASWCEEFYPVPASAVEPSDAIAHSLQKWRGLRVLATHGVRQDVDGVDLREEGGKASLSFGASTCALCAWYLADGEPDRCSRCPLAVVRGGVACDVRRPDEYLDPYRTWRDHADPEPMIRWLEAAATAATAVTAAEPLTGEDAAA